MSIFRGLTRVHETFPRSGLAKCGHNNGDLKRDLSKNDIIFDSCALRVFGDFVRILYYYRLINKNTTGKRIKVSCLNTHKQLSYIIRFTEMKTII